MANYSPVKSIRRIVPLLNKSIDDISEERWNAVSGRLDQLQSLNPQISIVLICRNEERNFPNNPGSISGHRMDQRRPTFEKYKKQQF